MVRKVLEQVMETVLVRPRVALLTLWLKGHITPAVEVVPVAEVGVTLTMEDEEPLPAAFVALTEQL
jgi:hypothetical protein